LYSALARGIDKMRLIAVWDGKSEIPKDLDARLVKHMVELMRETGGIVEQINPAKLSRNVVEVITVSDNVHSSVTIKTSSANKDGMTKPTAQKKKPVSKMNG
ncbi:MAG TPA: hypothetical protein VJM08_04430, partial [Anaerolineales bacterium]|nr:hypothetical protein [Anaerolineales bacterium]